MARSGSVLVDTGILVALLHDDDGRHREATEWLAGCKSSLHTVEAVLSETAFFLPPPQRAAVAEFAARGILRVHPNGVAAFKRIGAILRKYADLRPDWADAALVHLAEESGIHNIATFDVRDFSAYRINGRSKFLIEPIR
jgi:predicted nucleic acid-binding protein